MSLESRAFEPSAVVGVSAVAAVPGRTGLPLPRAVSRVLADRNVMEMALYTFGDFRTAENWMKTYHPRLKGEPVQACQGQSGQRMVIRLLQAIAHGTEP